MPDGSGSVAMLGQRSGRDFIDCFDMRSVGIIGGWGTGGLWSLHGDVWGIPHACAASGRELGATCGSFDAGRLAGIPHSRIDCPSFRHHHFYF